MAISTGKFKTPGAKSGSSRGGRKSRYAGLKARQPRTPRLLAGDYRLRVIRHEEGANDGKGTESFKCHWEVVECDEPLGIIKPGNDAFESFRTLGPGSNIQLEVLKAYVMAAAGYDAEDEEAFDEFAGEDGELFDALIGEVNDFSVDGGDPLVGREFLVQVLRGNPVERDGEPVTDPRTGEPDYYRDYRFAAADDQGRLGED